MSPARTAVGEVADTAAGVKTSVWLSNGSAGLQPRVLRLFGASDRVSLVERSQCETLVWLAAADADVLAEPAQPAQGVPSGLSAALAERHDLQHDRQHEGQPELRHVVLVSSAMVYGAWVNNPVPLTENSLLRPDVEFTFARQLGAAEQLVDEWRRRQPGRTVTVLRPAVAMAADGTSRLASALAAGMGQRVGTADPPSQFLHLDDLAQAVLLAVEKTLDGVFNVAPDGWIAGERVRALAGAVPRLKLPDRVNEVVTNLRWRFERGPIPPGLRSYTRSPWLVANDRLKAAGWRPNVTNEQAYVEGTEAKWWTMVSPKRRQEMTLTGLALAIAVVVALIVRAARRASATRQG